MSISVLFEICRKSEVNIIDAKTMSADPVAVVELPRRVPYGFHAFFVTEVGTSSSFAAVFGYLKPMHNQRCLVVLHTKCYCV